MEVSMAAYSPLMHTNSMGTKVNSLSVDFKSKSRNLKRLRIFCDNSCLEFWLNLWTEWQWENDIIAGFDYLIGSILLQRYGRDRSPNQPPELLPPQRVGIVFQFPERYCLADTLLEEVTFAWPKQKGGLQMREHLASNLARPLNWVGLNGVPFDKDPQSLSGGYKRRLALAIQLIQVPDLLILDEPLAGLDWKARTDVAKLLKNLKELTLLVVSHDLKELASLVDRSWRMEGGGVLKEEPLPL